MNFCPNCGGRLQNPEAQTCANCGFVLRAAPATEQPPSAAPPPAARGNTRAAPSTGLRPRPQLFDYDAPFEEEDAAAAGAPSTEDRQQPQFFDLDAPFEKETPPAETANGDMFATPPAEAGQSLFGGPRTQEVPLPGGAAPQSPFNEPAFPAADTAAYEPAGPGAAEGWPEPGGTGHSYFEEPDGAGAPEELPPAWAEPAESPPPAQFDEPLATPQEPQAEFAFPSADTTESTSVFEQNHTLPDNTGAPQAARAGAGNKGFEDLLNSVNSRYSAPTRRPAEPAPRAPQANAAEAFPQPGRVDQDYFFHEGAAPTVGAAPANAQSDAFFAPAAPPQPGRADQDMFQSPAHAADLFSMAAAADAADASGQDLFTPAADAQQNLFAQPQAAAPRQDLFADAQRAPASLDETQIFGGPPRNAPSQTRSQPQRTLPRTAAPPAPQHSRPAGQPQQPPRRKEAYPQEPALQDDWQQPASPADERTRRAAMVASISQAAAENTSSIPYDTDPGAPTPRVQQRARQPQAQRAPVRAVQQLDDYDEPAPRRSVGSIIGTVILFLLIFAIITAAATLGLLYWRNRPAAAINAYTAALQAKDVEELATLVTLNNTTSTVAGWEAMCAEFETESNMDELKSELAKVNMSATNENLRYPSIRLVGDDLFLFIKKYHVEATGVDALAPNAAEGTVLRLNGEDHTGSPAEGGILYQGILPGKYNCMVFAPGAVEAPETQQSIFSLTTPTVLGEGASSGTPAPSGATQTGEITIENCMNDEATLYLNDMILPDKPSGGVAHLTGVPVGAVVKITAEQDGKVYESSVTFSDPAATALRFENYTEVDVPSNDPTEFAAAVTPDEINTVLATFYTSYLNCINNQNTDGMQASTDHNTQALVSRITSADNAANTYKFVSATCKADSIKAGEQNGVPMLTFNGSFSFNFTPRDGSAAEAAASNHQSVRMIYDNGQWKVDGFTIVSDGDFNNNVIADM